MDRKVETRPPEVIERIVQLLVPPACREHVLGDLSERYASPSQYLADVLQTLPFVVVSRARRTVNPRLATATAVMLWFCAFVSGSGKHVWLAAAIPALFAIIVLILREAYRATLFDEFRPAAADVELAALGVLLSQGFLGIAFPSLLLSPDALCGGFPVGCIMLLFMRWETGGFHPPVANGRSISIQELMTDIRIYEAGMRRAIRIELGACVLVTVVLTAALFLPLTVAERMGLALTSFGSVFVGSVLYRDCRVRRIHTDLGFVRTLTAFREDLERRRKVSSDYFWWYVLPFLMGPATVLISLQIDGLISLVVMLAGVLVMFALAGLLLLVQQGVLRKTQERIGQLAVTEEEPSR